MSDLPRLLAALHQTPDDDLLWLAVADCLEEGGEPLRAELVRLERQLRGMEEKAERWAVEDRVRELVNGGVRPCVPEITNSIGMRLALIPAGTFWMGSPEGEGTADERPRHRVTLRQAFWMGVFPVTQGEYEAVTGKNPSTFGPAGGGQNRIREQWTPRFPVEMTSWDDAGAFCSRLSALPAEAGRVYRLPSEAEWEHACRAGLVSGAWHFGEDPGPTLAHFGAGLGRTCAVGGHPPNAFGLHDMHGNVQQWCQDQYAEEAYTPGPAIDPGGPCRGAYRVLRGGGWRLPARRGRSAARRFLEPACRYDSVGFRVCLTAS